MASRAPFTTPLPNVEDDPAALRVVLFGMPDAGKSSLLGALIQATHTQDKVLRGRLLDLSNGLAELWRRVYEERQRETREEIVPYPVIFEPYPGDPRAKTPLHLMLFDCDGRIANDLLSQRQSLQSSGKAGKLAQAVVDADTLILTIDASAGDEQIETDFREFVRFLGILETHRRYRRAVGGLPVYLALTKCDRLVKEPIAKTDWAKRISERQNQVKERFSRYLKRTAAPLTFGSIDLRVFPTAVKWPALIGSPAQPRSPLGVGELFHECLLSADVFRKRMAESNRRLKLVLAGAGSVLAIIAVFVIFLVRSGGAQQPLGLTEKVSQFQAHDKPLPDRLADDVLQRRATELIELRDSSDFDKLPDAQKNFVRDRLEELQAYLRLRQQVADIPPPEKARSLAELAQIQQKLDTQATIPAAFQQAWDKAPPPAVAERTRLLKLCQAIRDGVDELKTFYATLKNKANDRLFDTDFQTHWEDQAAAIFDNERNPPFARTDRPKGVAYDFQDVAVAEKEWLTARRTLKNVRDLALALGLIGDQSGPPAVLANTSVPTGESINTFYAGRLKNLKEHYPDWKTWTLAGVPDALQSELRKKLKRDFEQMVDDSRRLILDKFRQLKPTGDDLPGDWKEIAAWMLTGALSDWRDLLGFVSHLLDPKSDNPVDAAAAFMRKTSFDMQFKALTVRIPNNLPQGVMTPGETLLVLHRAQDENAAGATLSFRIDPAFTVEEVREKKYRFVLTEGDGKIVFKPGDEFRAELPLMKGTKAWEFIWSNSGTAPYAFDCLMHEPLLHAVGAAERGSVADGVSISIEGNFPYPPALLPNVKRERK